MEGINMKEGEGENVGENQLLGGMVRDGWQHEVGRGTKLESHSEMCYSG